jgi:hypothetical protein
VPLLRKPFTTYQLSVVLERLVGSGGLGRSQIDRANGSLFHRAFHEKVNPRDISKTPSKSPKLLSLIGPCNANASNYPAFLRALGRASLTPL